MAVESVVTTYNSVSLSRARTSQIMKACEERSGFEDEVPCALASAALSSRRCEGGRPRGLFARLASDVKQAPEATVRVTTR